MKEFPKRLKIGAEEALLASLILIEIIDFFTIIPAALEYAEKILSIIGICYLFYTASITMITTGHRRKQYDIAIITAYALLSIKTAIGFMISAAKEKTMMSGIYTSMVANADTIEKAGFYIGGILLIIAAVFLSRENIRRPSILSAIHESKKAETYCQKAVRLISTYLILIAIFITVFTFALEWLALSVDSPILVMILFFYLFVIVKRGKGMETESFLKKVSDSSEDFYKKFIALFHSRKTITTAITGLLVLHLIVEIGNFIIPYTTGLVYTAYFEQLGPGHSTMAALMANDFAAAGTGLMQIGVLLTYMLNVIAVVMLFFGPAYVWTRLYTRKKTIPPILAICGFFGSAAILAMEPVFRISTIKSQMVLGADITTNQIPFMHNVPLALTVALLVMGITYILARKSLKKTANIAFLAVLAYFGTYLYHFFTSLFSYYSATVGTMAMRGQYFIAAHLLLFFVVTIIFYIGGYLMFAYEAYIKQKL